MAGRPQPVLMSAVTPGLIAVVTTTLGLLGAFGLNVTQDQQTAILALSTTILGLVSTVVTPLLARRAAGMVTPLVDPRTNTGEPLTPASGEYAPPADVVADTGYDYVDPSLFDDGTPNG